ncbi:hypothetical protein SDC9_155603 [bioreactor metagenome]|uniref:Uncharacterized protein n=1 Tax=bioreactor metagenome TaxID=1076179 RepID=A0A645F213_9ZZZZ
MRQHRQHAPLVQRQQHGQADHQLIGRAAKHAPARRLAHAGVELIIQIHLVDRRPLDAALDALKRLEQLWAILLGQTHAVGRRHAHPQRLQAHPQQAQRGKHQHHPCESEPPGQQLRHTEGQQAQRQHHATDDPDIAQRGKPHHAAAIGAAVFGAGLLAGARQMHKIGVIHLPETP